MKSDLLPVLKKELQNSFGRKIVSSRDCLQMVDDIYQKTGYTINANTLRRFFGLVKTSYSASPSTLTILSKYCGFNSLDELEDISSGPHIEATINNDEIVHYLISLFKNFPVRDMYQPAMSSVVQQTIDFLERNPFLIEKFQRQVAAIPAGQYYYFEKSVNMDRLNGYYGEGLSYYLRAKNNNEAREFAYAMQVLRHWLTDDPELIEKNMLALASVPMSINYPSHILARSIAARLFYANFKGEIPDKILADAGRYYTAISSRVENPEPDFDLIVGEALILTNHIPEGNEYIRRGKSKLAPAHNPGVESLFSNWEKISHFRRNNATKINNKSMRSTRVNLVLTSSLNKKYFTLLSLPANNRTQRNNIAELLRETGFVRLSY